MKEVAFNHEKLGSGHEKLAVDHEKLHSSYENVGFKHKKNALNHEKFDESIIFTEVQSSKIRVDRFTKPWLIRHQNKTMDFPLQNWACKIFGWVSIDGDSSVKPVVVSQIKATTGCWFQPLWKILYSQWEGLSHILWKRKNVPNHQPAVYMY